MALVPDSNSAEQQDLINEGRHAAILAMGTANPPNIYYQADFPDFYFGVTKSDHKIDLKQMFKRMCDKTMIRKRHWYLTEEILKENPCLLDPVASSMDARHNILDKEVAKLGTEAAEKAIKEWGQPKSKITHLIFVTTSGVSIPGMDYQLIKILGLNNNIKRHTFYLQGCSAGGMALRIAKDLAECNNRSGNRVLIVCAEIIALLLFRSPSETEIDCVLAQSLFADGAAAAIVGTDPVIGMEKPLFQLVSTSQTMIPESEDAMCLRLEEVGLTGMLSRKIPALVSDNIDQLLIDTFKPIGISDWNSIFWITHPGGRLIIDKIEAKLGLNEDKMKASRYVLSEYGNMASPCVLFILDAMRNMSVEDGKSTTGDGLDWGVLFAFGPGLTVETIMLRSCPV